MCFLYSQQERLSIVVTGVYLVPAHYMHYMCLISTWQTLQGPSNPEQASSRLIGGQNHVLYTIIVKYCTSKIRRKSQVNLVSRNEKLQDEQKDKTKREYLQKPSVKGGENVLLYLV
jgi:hypothetical protein